MVTRRVVHFSAHRAKYLTTVALRIVSLVQTLNSVLPGFEKPNLGPTLFGQLQIGPGRREVSEMPATIHRQILLVLRRELGQLLIIIGRHPACREYCDR